MHRALLSCPILPFVTVPRDSDKVAFRIATGHGCFSAETETSKLVIVLPTYRNRERSMIKTRNPQTIYHLLPVPLLMQSQSSNESNPQPPFSRIALHTRQLFRANTQRAATWFSKPSFSRCKRKSDLPLPRHPSPSDSRSSLGDDVLPTYESLTLYSGSTRSVHSTPPQTTLVEHNQWPMLNAYVTIPIIPGYCF